MRQTHNLFDILDLGILHDLVMCCLSNIQQFTSKREHAKVVTPNYSETSLSESLGGVSFRQNQSAVYRFLPASVVRIR